MPIIEELGMQAAAGAIGGIMGMSNDNRQYKQQKKMQQLQIAGQKELTDYNAIKQLQMWKDTSYGAQKEQMKLAGINPALMYGMSGGGGQSAVVNAGNVSGGQGVSAGGELQAAMGIGLQMQLLKAQKDNIEADTANKKADTANKPLTGGNIKADTANKGLHGEVLKTTNELQKLDVKVNQETMWERINEIVSRSIEQQERGIQAGAQTEVQTATIQDNINRIKAEAINTGLQGASIRAGINLTEEQTRKVGQDILQKWTELNQTGTKNEWEHHDRLKAIEEYTNTTLKAAGIQAAGNVVRDVLGVVTRKVPMGRTTETYRDGKGTTITDTQYR